MLGELVLGSSSEKLRKVQFFIYNEELLVFLTNCKALVQIQTLPIPLQIVLFPIRGVCGGGLRSLVRTAKEKNICLNIGLGNQRPVKTETNRRTATDEFTLVAAEDNQNFFTGFGKFIDRKILEFEGQFWNDPDWFYGGMWPDQGIDID